MAPDRITAIAISTIPDGQEAIEKFVHEVQSIFDSESSDFELIGIGFNKREANRLFTEHKPNFIIVDLSLSGLRSIDIISDASNVLPDANILGLIGSDAPHDLPMLALQAGARGYVSMHADPKEVHSAIKTVFEGGCYFPIEETYEFMRQAAPELLVSAKERRAGIIDVILAFIPIAGILAAFTSYMWRSYWGQVGIRVSDLGVDASSRITELLVMFILFLGFIGPLAFFPKCIELLEAWFRFKLRDSTEIQHAGNHPDLIFQKSIPLYTSIVILTVVYWGFILSLISVRAGAFLFLFGIILGVVFIAHFMRSTEFLPNWLSLSRDKIRQSMVIFGGAAITLFTVMILEVRIGPDLREDGVHGYIAPRMLGLSARPALFHDLDGKREPLSALYVGGNADLYVLYDPCEKAVRLIPVGSSRVSMIREVQCASQ